MKKITATFALSSYSKDGEKKKIGETAIIWMLDFTCYRKFTIRPKSYVCITLK